MSIVKIADATMKQLGKANGSKLSFKNKLDLARLLDRLGVSVIEAEGIENVKADSLLIKSIAMTVKGSTIAVPVDLNAESVEIAWNAVKTAAKPRIQVPAPVSTVQMEYLYHKKPEAMMNAIKETVAAAAAVCPEVEFIAEDATRGDEAFLYEAIKSAIEAGAKIITVCDAAGAMLPDEFSAFITALKENVPELADVTLGVSCSDALSMASACAVAAVREGAREVKTASYSFDIAKLADVSKILSTKGGAFGVKCPVHTVEMNRVMKQIAWLCESEKSKTSPFDSGVNDGTSSVVLSAHDDINAVMKAVSELGYDLNDEDAQAVYEAFKQIASRKEEIDSKELDAIVATAAMQVPATYKLDSYVTNSGNIISSTAHVVLIKDGEKVDSISIGDGPIDAAFLALEQIAGTHYELDDFQIRAVTEGKEAMGETVVKLLSNGKLYAGKGISTDIIGASIKAYVNALNKIVYEETE
ncbi:MAG: alpha-isopropylmalate synthase regulatory domain-containing protein [Clostridia bacterium]|nr:alpha-isopropylmalate synthase regulatory domain-containing protein [Clostridia bacterium]